MTETLTTSMSDDRISDFAVTDAYGGWPTTCRWSDLPAGQRVVATAIGIRAPQALTEMTFIRTSARTRRVAAVPVVLVPRRHSEPRAPEIPGSINEGGELGSSLTHAYGAVFDNSRRPRRLRDRRW